jgi:hypothetical protein
VTEAVDEAAHAMSVFADALPNDRAVDLVTILRDLVRASMREVRDIEEPPEHRGPTHQRADALRAETLLRRLEAVSDATPDLGVAVRGLATILN